MIYVKLISGSKDLSIEASGHALFDKNGRDIVCASVSVLIESWSLGEKELCGADLGIEKDKGYFLARVRNYNKESKLLYDSLCLSLIFLENQYSKYIKVTVEANNG